MKIDAKVYELDALKGIYSSKASGRDLVQSAFGKTISLGTDVVKLWETGEEYIRQYRIFIQNWETVMESIKDEVEAERAKTLDDVAGKLKGYTLEQLDAIMAAAKALKGVEPAPAAE